MNGSMSIETMINALAEVHSLCAGREVCKGCLLEIPSGCLARSTNLEDAEDYPANWAIGEKK